VLEAATYRPPCARAKLSPPGLQGNDSGPLVQETPFRASARSVPGCLQWPGETGKRALGGAFHLGAEAEASANCRSLPLRAIYIW